MLKPPARSGWGPSSPAGATLRISHSLESFGSGTPSSSSSSSREMTLGLGIGKSAPEKGGKKTPGLLQVCYVGFIKHYIYIYIYTYTLFKGNTAFCVQVSSWERKAIKGISRQQTMATQQVTSLLASPVFRGGMCHPSTTFLCTQRLKKNKLPQKLHFLFPLCPPPKKHEPCRAKRACDAKGRCPTPWCWLRQHMAGTAFVLAAPAGCVFYWQQIIFWQRSLACGGAGGGTLRGAGAGEDASLTQ